MRGGLSADEIARAFREACLAELDALKPGNVHRHADDPRMSVEDFELSARVAGAPLAMPMIPIGARIRLAVEATINIVGHNTNLGIILLCAPLAAAALARSEGDLRQRVTGVLSDLDVEDAKEAYAAIRLARPGGLGAASSQDVVAEPGITLLEAMRLAETRDRIAWNYTHEFTDIFDLGLPRLRDAELHGEDASFATSSVYLGFLARIPDTLIERKFGAETAREVLSEAGKLDVELQKTDDPQDLIPDLLRFDRSLKARGLNPGTTADLTVATLFACALESLEGRG